MIDSTASATGSPSSGCSSLFLPRILLGPRPHWSAQEGKPRMHGEAEEELKSGQLLRVVKGRDRRNSASEGRW